MALGTRGTPHLKIEREIKQVIVVRKDLHMGTGKIAAQASHASLLGYLEAVRKQKTITEKWMSEGGTKIVVKVDSESELNSIASKLARTPIPFKVIVDAGQTQIPPGTKTAIGIGPYLSGEIDKITGDLKLL